MSNERFILIFERAIIYTESLNAVYIHRDLVRKWEEKHGKLVKWYRILTNKTRLKNRTKNGQTLLDMFMFTTSTGNASCFFLDQYMETVLRKDANYRVFVERSFSHSRQHLNCK